MNLPSLVLKARHLGGFAFCNVDRLGVPEQALGEIPLGFGIAMEDIPSELSCNNGSSVDSTEHHVFSLSAGLY